MTQYPSSTVFMLAPQRHGSNKTQSLLSANHPDLYGPYPPVLRQAFKKLEEQLGDTLLEAMVHSANLSPRPLVDTERNILLDEVEREIARRNLPKDALGISIAITHVGARQSGQSSARVLCKSPDNLEIAEEYKDRFVDTAFIHLIRDPRAVWNSGRGTPRGPQTPHASAMKWADYHARVQKLSRHVPIITLTYEQLMLQPHAELKRACDFLHIPFTPEMLEDHSSTDARNAASTNPGLWGNLAKPIMHSRIEAWKTELPQREIEIIERTCRDVMEAYGYAPLFPTQDLTQEDVDFAPVFSGDKRVDEPRKAQLDHLEQLQTGTLAIQPAQHGDAHVAR